MHYITILYDIILTLNSQFACLPACSLTAKSNEIFVLDDFGTNKPALKISMDHSGALRSFGSCSECPSSYLVTTCREERTEVKQCISSLDESVHT